MGFIMCSEPGRPAKITKALIDQHVYRDTIIENDHWVKEEEFDMKTITRNVLFIVILFAAIFVYTAHAAPNTQIDAIGSYILGLEYRTERYSNGDQYEGYFLNGLYNGEGKYTWSNGDCYEGEFMNGQINGTGRLTFFGTGQYWEGNFVQGTISTGTGIFYYGSNGDKFDGEWVNGQPNGVGILLHPDGTSDKVTFQNGQMIPYQTKDRKGKDYYINLPEQPNQGYYNYPFANIKIGDIVSFGTYEQDNNSYNGPEPIQWRCLDIDIQTGRALLLSIYGLDTIPYNQNSQSVTWEDSSIRYLLNNYFYYESFTDIERQWIAETEVINNGNPTYGIYGGNNTNDHVFLLSMDEVRHYSPTEYPRKTQPTPVARAHGAYGTADPSCAWWWLRTPGRYSSSAACINSIGVLLDTGTNVSDTTGMVRPAIWVTLAG